MGPSDKDQQTWLRNLARLARNLEGKTPTERRDLVTAAGAPLWPFPALETDPQINFGRWVNNNSGALRLFLRNEKHDARVYMDGDRAECLGAVCGAAWLADATRYNENPRASSERAAAAAAADLSPADKLLSRKLLRLREHALTHLAAPDEAPTEPRARRAPIVPPCAETRAAEDRLDGWNIPHVKRLILRAMGASPVSIGLGGGYLAAASASTCKSSHLPAKSLILPRPPRPCSRSHNK
jgi:hypothetical protein